MRKDLPAHDPPPVLHQGYAVFVKILNLSANTPADLAFGIFQVVDEVLLKLVKYDAHRWFPSPYGGAIVVTNVETALRASKTIMDAATGYGIRISIGISYGSFERIHNVHRWNVAALAMNIAARLAHNDQTEGFVTVDSKVHDDAISAKVKYQSIFGDKEIALVKRTSLEFYRIVDRAYVQIITGALRVPIVRKNTRQAVVVVFDIERYSEKSGTEQAKIAERLSKCVEIAGTTVGVLPTHFGPAGDGGYLAFILEETSQVYTAWPFAATLREQARQEEIVIRIGLASGPILSSPHRAIIGSPVLIADHASSLAPSQEIAVTAEFWKSLPEYMKLGWDVPSPVENNSVLILREKRTSHSPAEVKSVLSDASPIDVRTVLFTLHNKQGMEIPLSYFQQQKIKVIATPNTAKAIKSLGFECTTTFEYTNTPELFTSRGSLHPYILMSIATGLTDDERLQMLRANGLDSIDLVFVNTTDPLISRGLTTAQFMEQMASVQIGGPSLLRWSLKQWKTVAAVVNPEDYEQVITDLHTNDNRLSPSCRLALLRRAMEYLATKDSRTCHLFEQLWTNIT